MNFYSLTNVPSMSDVKYVIENATQKGNLNGGGN
jgi:hypothetical protein